MSESKERIWNPTPNQRAFVENVIATDFQNITESYRQAYPDASGKYLNVEAYRLLKNPKIKALIEEIQQDLRSKFVLLAPEALYRLEELAATADSEKVKLEANLELLDRAGLTKVQKVEFSPLGVFGQASPEDIKKSIRDKQEEKNTITKELTE